MNQREEFLNLLNSAIEETDTNVSDNSLKVLETLKSEFLKLFPENYQENEFLELLIKQEELFETWDENMSESVYRENVKVAMVIKLLKKKYLETHKASEG